jgi:ribose 5-phosphate isomerase RpiB
MQDYSLISLSANRIYDDSMRLLILSNVAGSVDKIVDSLGKNHNVIAKESGSTSPATMANTAAEQLKNGKYDEVIVIAKDPIGMGMLLNKQEGVVAAVCGSTEDVSLAKQNGANAIVIRDIDSEELYSIVVQATGSGGMISSIKMPQVKMPQLKMPEMKMPQLPRQQLKQEAQPREDKRQRLVAQKKPKQEAEDEEEEERPPSNDSGIVGKIKDYLVIL